MKKTFELTVFNQNFKIRTEDDEKHVKKVADLVNKKVTEIAASGHAIANLNVAVLAALNIADEFYKQKDEFSKKVENWKGRIENFLNTPA